MIVSEALWRMLPQFITLLPDPIASFVVYLKWGSQSWYLLSETKIINSATVLQISY